MHSAGVLAIIITFQHPHMQSLYHLPFCCMQLHCRHELSA